MVMLAMIAMIALQSMIAQELAFGCRLPGSLTCAVWIEIFSNGARGMGDVRIESHLSVYKNPDALTLTTYSTPRSSRHDFFQSSWRGNLFLTPASN